MKEGRFDKVKTLIARVQADYAKKRKPNMRNAYIVHKLASKYGKSERRIYQILNVKKNVKR